MQPGTLQTFGAVLCASPCSTASSSFAILASSLSSLATTRSMEGNHLRPHRALDDAKAERDWTTNNTKLKALTTVLTQEKVVITLPQYRAYHEQYDKRSAKLKELGTHNKESS